MKLGPEKTTALQKIALHEASHATIATYLGLPVLFMALRATHDGGSPGLWSFGGECGQDFDGCRPLDAVAVMTAGYAGVSLHDPACTFDVFADSKHNDSPRDLEAAHSWLDRLQPAPSDKRRRQILERQWTRSGVILQSRWGGVVTLANALLTRYDQKYAEAVEISLDRVSLIRAVMSGEELTRLLEFAK